MKVKKPTPAKATIPPVATIPVEVDAASADVFQNCVALMVSFSTFGNRRTIEISTEEAAGADPEMLNLTKALFDPKALRDVNRVATRTKRRLLDSCAVPSFAADGMYLLSTPGVTIAHKILTEEKAILSGVVDKIIAGLPNFIEDAKLRLGPRFNEKEYPTAAELKGHFGMRWRFLSLGAPAQLQAVSDEFLKAEQDKIAADSARAAGEIRTLYRATLLQLTGHLVDMLRPGPDGKPRRFHESALTKISKFLSAMPVQNITNDADIVAIGEKAKKLLAGIDVALIKDDELLRAKVADDMAVVTAELKTLVALAPTRAIHFDDDDAPMLSPGRKAALTRQRSKPTTAAA